MPLTKIKVVIHPDGTGTPFADTAEAVRSSQMQTLKQTDEVKVLHQSHPAVKAEVGWLRLQVT